MNIVINLIGEEIFLLRFDDKKENHAALAVAVGMKQTKKMDAQTRQPWARSSSEVDLFFLGLILTAIIDVFNFLVLTLPSFDFLSKSFYTYKTAKNSRHCTDKGYLDDVQMNKKKTKSHCRHDPLEEGRDRKKLTHTERIVYRQEASKQTAKMATTETSK